MEDLITPLLKPYLSPLLVYLKYQHKLRCNNLSEGELGVQQDVYVEVEKYRV